MKRILTIFTLAVMGFNAYAQKDEFAGFYAGKNGDDQIFAEVFKAHDDSYRLRLYSAIIEENGEKLSEISHLKAADSQISAKLLRMSELKDGDSKKSSSEYVADLTITPSEINGNFNDKATRLMKITYESPSMGQKPIDGAKVLFDGKDLASNWTMGKKDLNWIIKDGIATIDNASKSSSIISKDSFGSLRMHLEFKTPPVYNEEKQQKRGNSGIKFGPYEVQILDSFGTEELNHYDVGSIYSLNTPLVNAALEPDAWQTFDIEFIAVKYDDKGEIASLPRFTVYLNGVLVQDNVEVSSPTNAKEKKKTDFKHPEKIQLQLQNHKHDVSFRNIWLVEL